MTRQPVRIPAAHHRICRALSPDRAIWRACAVANAANPPVVSGTHPARLSARAAGEIGPMRPSVATRRAVVVPHLGDRAKLRRCPICQWVIDQDHAEALAIELAAVRTAQPAPGARQPAARTAGKPAEPSGFALVESSAKPARAREPRPQPPRAREVEEPEGVLESVLA
jgi:hypothetical protein